MDNGKKIFIGHGESQVWRGLKDFIGERLHLQYDEFNRVPTAGGTTVERLSQMLDDASFAFLVLTAEDQIDEETVRARQNVVHEAGLFQGRLGFKRAIILLEEGCEEFSNIVGLGQIRFPKGNVAAAFEEIRRVLAREKIFGNGSEQPQQTQQAPVEPSKPALSKLAAELIAEIDSQDENRGEGRGISLFPSSAGAGQGHYFPYLWSPYIHEGQQHVTISGLGPVRRAVAELERAGLLGLDSDDGSISRYFRTETPLP